MLMLRLVGNTFHRISPKLGGEYQQVAADKEHSFMARPKFEIPLSFFLSLSLLYPLMNF
jgi:hypothetical protein